MKRVTYHTVESDENYHTQLPPEPEVWEWVKKTPDGDVHIFEDELLPNHVKYNGKIKIACLRESPAIYDYCAINNSALFHPYRWLQNNHQHFQYVMSPFKEVANLVGDKYLWMPSGGLRIKKDDIGMYEKERNISIVASAKRWTVGHRMRHDIIAKYPGKIDAYGSGYNNVVSSYENDFGKILAIGPYRYSFAIMNDKKDDYFTEILTDVLAAGTVPIWWGTDNIGKYFNIDGFVTFNTIEELDALMPTLTPELYQSKLNAIIDNTERVKDYITRFDWVYKNLKGKFENL